RTSQRVLSVTHLCFSLLCVCDRRYLHSFPTRRSSDLSARSSTSVLPTRAGRRTSRGRCCAVISRAPWRTRACGRTWSVRRTRPRSEEHTSELQSRENLVCRLLLEKKKKL